MGTCHYCGKKTVNPTTCQECGICFCPRTRCQIKHRSEHLNARIHKGQEHDACPGCGAMPDEDCDCDREEISFDEQARRDNPWPA